MNNIPILEVKSLKASINDNEILKSYGSISMHEVLYKKGDKVAQLIIVPYPSIELEEVEELSSTERGDGGFGSTTSKL